MLPRFELKYLLPNYWLTWLGIGLLYMLVQLPYPVIYRLGIWSGSLSQKILRRRAKIAYTNLSLCFPNWSTDEIKYHVKKNFESVGMGLFETGMAWFWSNRRIRKWCAVEGLENLNLSLQQNRGVLLIGIHFLTLELGGRILGLYKAGIGVYRPHNNPLLNWIQYKGRLKSNKDFIERHDMRKMIKSLKNGEILWYAPDHDYGRKNMVFASFFAMPQASTTIGTSLLMRVAEPKIISFAPLRNHDGSGYTLSISPARENFPMDDKNRAAEFMNRIIEAEIMKDVDLYMWIHRRFKTRPTGSTYPY